MNASAFLVSQKAYYCCTLWAALAWAKGAVQICLQLSLTERGCWTCPACCLQEMTCFVYPLQPCRSGFPPSGVYSVLMNGPCGRMGVQSRLCCTAARRGIFSGRAY